MFMPTAETFARAEAVLPALLGGRDARTFGPGRTGGMAAATLVETGAGWRAAGTLCEGMRVETWDGGLVEIAEVRRARLGGGVLVEVPAGAIGNCSELTLLPGQQVMVGSAAVEELFGAAGALIEARALIGFRGTLARPAAGTEVIALALASDELIWAQTGALLRAGEGESGLEALLPVLGAAQARAMLELMEAGSPWGTAPALARAA